MSRFTPSDRRLAFAVAGLAVVLLLLIAAGASEPAAAGEKGQPPDATGGEAMREVTGAERPSEIIGGPSDTAPREQGSIAIAGVGRFSFDAAAVETARPDLFEPGHFSVFDVLVHLDSRGDIELRYRFDRASDTHVIESIDGRGGFWYTAYYDGGWSERNVFRMDYFPYKDGMTIQLSDAGADRLDSIRRVHRAEYARYQADGNSVEVGLVRIQGPTAELEFHDVEVTAHDLRSDMLQPGTVTAIDVILSLADQGKLSYRVEWIESIGIARVNNYMVERINDDRRRGRCGFVYEAGPEQYRGFRGNHIHLPPDARIIRSPEYLEFFWICV